MSSNLKVLIKTRSNAIVRNPRSMMNLYTNILNTFYDLNIDVKLKFDSNKKDDNNDIIINLHTHSNKTNLWHIKPSYIQNFFYFDSHGYSGWSEAKHRYNNNQKFNQEDIDYAFNVINNIKENKITKIPTKLECEVPNCKYVLVMAQNPHDSVSKLAYIQTKDLCAMVNNAYQNSNITVFTKLHPLFNKPNKFAGKKICGGNIHELIQGAEAIYTVNSGAGFESLLHYKKVFTSGDCDYSHLTTVVKTQKDIIKTKEMLYEPVNRQKYDHFLIYCFTDLFVNCYDHKRILNKVKRVINEYEIPL